MPNVKWYPTDNARNSLCDCDVSTNQCTRWLSMAKQWISFHACFIQNFLIERKLVLIRPKGVIQKNKVRTKKTSSIPQKMFCENLPFRLFLLYERLLHIQNNVLKFSKASQKYSLTCAVSLYSILYVSGIAPCLS